MKCRSGKMAAGPGGVDDDKPMPPSRIPAPRTVTPVSRSVTPAVGPGQKPGPRQMWTDVLRCAKRLRHEAQLNNMERSAVPSLEMFAAIRLLRLISEERLRPGQEASWLFMQVKLREMDRQWLRMARELKAKFRLTFVRWFQGEKLVSVPKTYVKLIGLTPDLWIDRDAMEKYIRREMDRISRTQKRS